MSCVPTLKDVASHIDEAAWKKALGAYKIIGKTGISEAIRKVHEAWGKIDNNQLDSHACLKNCTSPTEADEAKLKAVGYLDKLAPSLVHPVSDLQKLITAKLPEFKKSVTFPKAARLHAEAMQKEAADLIKGANGLWFDELERDFKTVMEKKLVGMSMAAEKLKNYLGKWDAAFIKLVQDVKEAKDETEKLDAYNSKFWKEYVRGFGTALPFFKANQHLGKHYAYWVKVSSEGGKPKDTKALIELIKEIGPAAVTLKADAKKAGIID